MTNNTQSIVVTINTINDAFLFPSPDLEVARILRDLADRIDDGHTPSFLYDANGNVTGNVALFNQPSNI
jgi:hypothetical protein